MNTAVVGKDYSKLIDFEEAFRSSQERQPLSDKVKAWLKKNAASYDPKQYALDLVPLVKTIRKYKTKTDLPNDVIAGLTSGVMMIPQGMAFAALSTLQPIVGLYISFFASVTYVVMGTGRQVSWGCIAILSLMIADILDKYDSQFSQFETNVNTTHIGTDSLTNVNLSSATTIPLTAKIDPLPNERRTEVASGVTVMVALIMIIASRLGFSRVTCIMSHSLITGYTVGLSFHVFTSQLKGIFGVSVTRFKGPAKVLRTWIEVCVKLPETNVTTLIISITSIAVIYLVKKFVNEKFKHRLRIPVPIELCVLIAGTLASNFGEFNNIFGVDVVEDVPTGIPSPKLPDVSLVQDYIGDGLVIILVAYAQTLAMAKTMGLRHDYPVDANQEMLACGMCNLVCGLFSGYVTGGSVSRSVVQDGAGGKTQFASLIAAGLVLLVIMVMGPYFYHLPMCVLAAIIVVNLRGMLLKFMAIPQIWRRSKYDCLVWVVTFIATVVLNADVGLIVGVGFSLLLIFLRTMFGTVVEAGRFPHGSHNGELRSLTNYPSAFTYHGVKIVRIQAPLYFINADAFTVDVFERIGINPTSLKAKAKKMLREIAVPEQESKGATTSDNHTNGTTNKTNGAASLPSSQQTGVNIKQQQIRLTDIRVVVFDASEVAFIDLMGVKALEFVIAQLSAVGVETYIICLKENVFSMLKSTGFWEEQGHRMYLNLDDVLQAGDSSLNHTRL